jgi:sulfur-oxidizing protein SoxA
MKLVTCFRSAAALLTSGAMVIALAFPAFGQEQRGIAPLNSDSPLNELISGTQFSPVEARALEDDDFDNPGFAWVSRGETSWRLAEGSAGKSCSACHGVAGEALRGWAADYPKYHGGEKRLIDLEQRINFCRREKMGAEPWPRESAEMLGMTAFLGVQSRGIALRPRIDGAAKAAFETGQKLHTQRMGQLGMSCSGCHDRNYGKSYDGRIINQGHPNGFPAYRMSDQSFGSLHRQFTACFERMKAEAFPPGSDEYIALELYLAWRGAGLPMQTPSVRR